MSLFVRPGEKPGIGAPSAWIRWLPFWHSFAYLAMTVIAVLSLWPPQGWPMRGLLIVGSLIFAAWYSICVCVDPLWWRKHTLKTCGYLWLGWLIWMGLAYLNASFYYILFLLFAQIFLFPAMPWKIALALGLIVLAALFASLVYGATPIVFFGLMFVSMLTAFLVDKTIRQNYLQRNLIKQLEETRQELARAERQAGIVEERQRLAYEIHDTLAQGFTSIAMYLEAADAMWQGDADIARQHIDRARRVARENVGEARRLIWALQPEMLGRASLGEVLSTLTAQWSLEHDIAASANVTGTVYPLRPEHEQMLLRAAQEALTNARKHAQASQITITLSYMDQMVTLDVEDNGVGFAPCTRDEGPDPGAEHAGGFGLKGLRERVEKLGGMLTVESAPGEGTILAIALPVAPLVGEEYAL